MHKAYIARMLLVIALILLVLSVASYDIVSSYTPVKTEKANTSACNQIYTSIDRNATYVYRGKSISSNRVDTWYDVYGCGNKLVYVRISRPLYLHSRHAVVLIHDYMSDYYSLIGLMLKFVSQGYIVLQVGLPGKGIEHIKILTEKPEESWVYESVCDVMKTITLLQKEYEVDNIGVVGIGFGGIVALITAMYDDRIDYVASIAGYGDYEYSVEKASLLNYYIEGLNDLNPCLDPINMINKINKPVLIIVGTNDEINPINPQLLNKLIENPNIVVSIVPNGNRYRVPLNWENILLKFLNMVSSGNSISKNEVEIIDNGFEVIVKAKNYSNIMVLAKPAIPGYTWSTIYLINEQIKLTYLILPGEYIIVDKEMYRVYGFYITRESYGIIIALVLILIWIVIERNTLSNVVRKMNILEFLYVASLLSILFYTSYPSLFSPDRYHVSLNILAEVYARSLPFISYIVLASMILQPILLVYMFSRHSRTAYSLYIGIPLFTIILTYTFMLFIGFRFYYMIPLLPSTSLIPIIVAMILDYILGREIQ